MSRNLFSNDTGVSETLGYIIIFGIVFSCIAIVVVSGNQVISNTEEKTMFQGMEQSFNVLSSDLRKTAFDTSPMRTLQIRCDGSIAFTPGDFELRVTRSDGTPIYPASAAPSPIGSIMFRSSHIPQSIWLEDGAVVKNFADYTSSDASSIMSRQPRMYVSDDMGRKTLIVSVIKLEGVPGGIGGQGVADIQMSYDGVSTYSYTPGNNIARIYVKTGNVNAWKSYFSDQFKDYTPLVTTANDAVTVELHGVDEVTVLEYKIKVSVS